MFQATTATQKILKLRKRIRAIAGGTSASKTISILLVLIDMAQKDKVGKTTHIVSESLPHLKLAAMADFLRIMKEHGYYDDTAWNRTDYVYTFGSGSVFQFYGADSSEKVHGPRRDRLFVNEANNVPFESFDQMEVRTNEVIFLDWNPTNEFWFYESVLPTRTDDLDFITLTYKDNEALPESIVKSIESRQGNKNWWLVYGLGQMGNTEGIIFQDWKIITEIPHEARLERYWLDFGYTQDPTAIGAIYYYNGGYILDEVAYQNGMSNKMIADIFLNLPLALVKADSAEPKSIDEIKSLGVNVVGAAKGSDSIKHGIQRIQGEQISVTQSSVNIIKERRNYMWMDTKKNTPIDSFNHHMDGIRYGFEGLREHNPKLDQQVSLMQRLAQAGDLYGSPYGGDNGLDLV